MRKTIVDPVGADSAHREPNAGDGLGRGAEPDLGLQVWRRHVSPGLIAHTQSSRVWRQATQVGQVPLVNHVAARFGTGGSDFRTWDSLPFVMAKRAPRILARAIPAAGSLISPAPIQETGELQADITLPPHAHSSDGQSDSTAISHHMGRQALPTNSSLIVLRRQVGPAAPEGLPLLRRSDGATLGRSIAEGTETASVSPAGHGDQVSHGDQGDLEGEAASDHQQVTDDAFHIPPGHQTGDLQPTAQRLDTRADLAVTPTLRNVAPEAILLRSRRHQSSPASGDTVMATGGSSIRSHKDWGERGTDHIQEALQSPIVRRVLRREALPVSQKSGDSHQSVDGGDQQTLGHGNSNSMSSLRQLPLLIQTKPGGEVESDDSEMVRRTDKMLVVRRQQFKPLDTLSTSLSFDQPHVLRTLSTVSLATSRHSFGDTHADVQGERSPIDPLLWRLTSAFPDARPMGETSSVQRSPTDSSQDGFPAEGGFAGPASTVPLVHATDRPLQHLDSPAILWRSAIPGISKDARSIERDKSYQAVSGSIKPASSPVLAREAANPSDSYVSRPDMPSMNGLPALAESRHASPSVNVADLAEQVGRFLTKQLIVERERRGVSL